MNALKKSLRLALLLSLPVVLAAPGGLAARHPMPSAQTAAGLVGIGAYQVLTNRVTFNRTAFYVYQDADSGYNHGFPSGFFGADPSDLGRIHLNPACVNEPASAAGCSADVNALDRERGNVLSVSFDPLPAGHFAGVNFQEPQNYVPSSCDADPVNCKGYSLSGATNIVFDLRSPTPGGVTVQFGVGGGVAGFFHVPQSSTFTTLSIVLNSMSPAPNLTNTHILFSVATNSANAPGGGTLLLDNIRFESFPTNRPSPLDFPLANETFGVVPRTSPGPGRVPIPPDQLLRNLTTTYESALTLQALLRRGTGADLAAARPIAEAFLYALEHDNHGAPLPVAPDGSTGLHNGYESGDLALLNSQGPGQGQAGDVRLSGFTAACGSSSFCLQLDGATGGNNAFAVLALAAASREFKDVRYLDAAKRIGRWIIGNLTDTTGTGYGGYYLGYPDEGRPKVLITGKSVENNADIYAAFYLLAGIEREAGDNAEAEFWGHHANAAGDFVMRMFDATNGRFNAGTVPVGTAAGPGVAPDPSTTRGNDVINTFDFLDANSFTTLALAESHRYRYSIDWRRPVRYMADRFRQTVTAGGQTFRGFNLVQTPTAGPNGIAWEFTAQVVSSMRLVTRLYHVADFRAEIDLYQEGLRQAQTSAPFGDGLGLVASTLEGGDALPPGEQCLSTPFQCIAERVGLAATTWGIFADLNFNPLASNAGESVGLYNPSTGIFFLRYVRAAGQADAAFSYGPAGSGWRPVAGDWDGLGIDTVGLYNPSTSTFFLRNSNWSGAADIVFPFGPAGAGWIPLAGDWDGDGLDTVGLYDPSSGAFFLKNRNTAGGADLFFHYGPEGANWTPLAGDWDGDGVTTIGLFNPDTSTFYLRNSNTAGFADLVVPYGPLGVTWVPLAGDWNGDGVTTVGLYNPSSSTFFLKNSNTQGGADLVFPYGPAGSGWTPLVGNWNGL